MLQGDRLRNYLGGEYEGADLENVVPKLGNNLENIGDVDFKVVAESLKSLQIKLHHVFMIKAAYGRSF